MKWIVCMMCVMGFVNAAPILNMKTWVPQEVNENSLMKGTQITQQYKTVIDVDKLEGDIKLFIERPLLREFKSEKNKKFHINCVVSKEVSMASANAAGKDKPCIIICSEGFLPGEEVKLWVEDKKENSKPLVFTPHPLVMKSKNDNAVITLKLSGMITSTSSYLFSFSGFKPGEVLSYSSTSCGETIQNKLKITRDLSFGLMCGVIGHKGGTDTVKFIRENGEVLSLTIPWGNLLGDYLKGGKDAIVAD